MTYAIDQILNEYSQKRTLREINRRNDEILNSLSKQIAYNVYLTKRQADLALKIFKDNHQHFPSLHGLLENPVWSREFRTIEYFKYLHLVKPPTQDRYLLELGFNHNKSLSKKLDELKKRSLTNPLIRIKNNVWQIVYCEKDLHSLVNLVSGHNFDISPEILEVYQEIDNILKTPNHDQIYIDVNGSEYLKNSVLNDIGTLDKTNILLEDRKIKFQYEIFDSFFQKTPAVSLEEKIAVRTDSQVYISPTNFSLTEIVSALQKLQRFPALIVFDNNAEKSMKILEKLNTALTVNNITDPVGIYFRHDNDKEGKPLNEMVSQMAYNKPLNNNTAIVGITNWKIPKFLLKMQWRPRSVIVMSSVFGSNRVNLYTKSCDLVIFHQDKKPLTEAMKEIV
jgi:hypothetical protein